MLPSDLIQRWREDAALLRKRFADERGAALFELHALELEQSLAQADHEVLTLTAAAKLCGYTVNHLGRLVAEGKLQNVGRKHAPRIRRKDLPVKPGVISQPTETRSDITSIGRIGRSVMRSRARSR